LASLSVQAQQSDSTKNKLAVDKNPKAKADSLSAQSKVDKYNQKVAVLQKRFNHRLDSLSKLPEKNARVTKAMNRLNKKMKRLKNAKSVKEVEKGERQLAKLQSVNAKVKSLESKVNKELSAMNLGNIKAPNLNVTNLNVPKVNLPGTTLPNTNQGSNTSMPNNTAPSQGNTGLSAGNVAVPGVAQQSAAGLNNVSSSLKEIGKINLKLFRRSRKQTPKTSEGEKSNTTAQGTSNGPEAVGNKPKPLADSLNTQHVVDNKSAEEKSLNKPAAVDKKSKSKADSLEVDKYNQKVAVLQKHFNHHLDSLSKLAEKDARVTKSMSRLEKKMKKLRNARSIKDVEKGERQLTKLQPGLNAKVKGLESQVNKELSAMNLGNIKAPNLNVPNLNVPQVNLPGANATLPNTNLGLNTSVPNTTPSLGNTNLPTGNTPVPGAQSNVTGLPNVSSGLPSNILPGSEMKELSNIQKEAGQITKATGEINKVEGEIKNANPANVEKTLEKDAQNIKEVKQLTGQTAQVEQYKKMVEKWESDPEYRKELAVTKAKEQAVNHFAGQEKQLMAAMQQLSNVKAKYKDYEGTLDMFKKPGNAMKEKPFIERVRPGFNLQIQSKREVMLDFNPQVGYRISGRITAGIGWNERWGYDFNKWNYISNDHVFGPRAYAHIRIKTGVYAMVAPEVMNALVPPYYNSPDLGTRKWVWTWMAGIKKEFRYSKNLLGNLQVLYNLFDKHNQSPYVSKLNIRMGFEFQLKKHKQIN
jgi:hypothetical protein